MLLQSCRRKHQPPPIVWCTVACAVLRTGQLIPQRQSSSMQLPRKLQPYQQKYNDKHIHLHVSILLAENGCLPGDRPASRSCGLSAAVGTRTCAAPSSSPAGCCHTPVQWLPCSAHASCMSAYNQPALSYLQSIGVVALCTSGGMITSCTRYEEQGRYMLSFLQRLTGILWDSWLDIPHTSNSWHLAPLQMKPLWTSRAGCSNEKVSRASDGTVHSEPQKWLSYRSQHAVTLYL